MTVRLMDLRAELDSLEHEIRTKQNQAATLRSRIKQVETVQLIRGPGTEELHDLLVSADSICSLILYRESSGLSDQTVRDLDALVTRLRVASQG